MSAAVTTPNFRAKIKAVGTGRRGSRPLDFDEARDAMRALLAGETTHAQAGAFLIAMRIKGEDATELAGLARAMRDAAFTSGEVFDRTLVSCAGAYDGVREVPQLSLAAAVVAAACGAACVVSCGGTLGPKNGATPLNVLEALGGPGRPTVDESRRMLSRSGVAVVHAGEAIPGWDRLAELRDEVGVRGPVHTAEKLVDHFGATRFVVGYAHQPFGPRLLEALARLGAENAVAVRGAEGSDVVRPGRPQAHALGGVSLELPQRLGERLPLGTADAQSSAALTAAVMAGDETGPAAHAVIVSAALRVYAAEPGRRIEDAIARAARAIADGSASATLEALAG